MINEFLSLISSYTIEELDEIAKDYHKMDAGYYFIISKDRKNIIGPIEIKDDTTSGEYYEKLRVFDYYSYVVNQKELDGNSHKIRANNCLSFGFNTKENDVKDEHFEIAKNKILSYNTDNKILEIHKVLSIQQIDNEQFVCENMNLFKNYHDYVCKQVDEILKNNKKPESTKTKKVLIKIFIDEDIEKYKIEHLRYLSSIVFGKGNSKNKKKEDNIIGPSSFGISFNYDDGKKLLVPREKEKDSIIPIFITIQNALKLQIFDNILNGLRNVQKSDENYKDEYIYLPFKNDFIGLKNNSQGYKVKIKRGKTGICILDFELNTGPQIVEKNNFTIRNILNINPEYFEEINLENALNKYLFDGLLISNYTRSVENIYIPETMNSMKQYFLKTYCNVIYDYFYYNEDIYSFYNNLFNLVKNICANYNSIKAFNLYLNLEEHLGGKKMNIKESVEKLNENLKGIYEIQTDEEYMFAIGQMIKYLISQKQSDHKNQNLYAPFINCKSTDMLLTLLIRAKDRYDHSVAAYGKYEKLWAAIAGYNPNKKTVTMEMTKSLMVGLYTENVLYIKDKKEDNSQED